jgi:hypothetical protein
MAGASIKGALISFLPTAIGPIQLPNVIVFQFNPETMTHTWSEATAAPGEGRARHNPLTVSGLPGEKFSFTLSLDANEMIADAGRNPVGAGLAFLSGVQPRLAALEMLLYPMGSASSGLLGTVSAASNAVGFSMSVATSQSVPESQVPVVLFVWGLQRIVPVRVTDLTITEKLYDTALNPVHADAQIGLRVLTPDEIVAVHGPMKTIATVAYVYTQGLRQAQAVADLGDSAADIIGMLPIPL